MGQQQREARRAAARAFMESLAQLQQTLEPVEEASAQPVNGSKSAHPPKPSRKSSIRFDLDSLEDAIADIEQFIEQKEEGRG